MIRVTEVLDYFKEPWMLDWYAKNGKAHCNRVSKTAMKVGTRVDELIKNNYSTGSSKDKEEVYNCMSAYRKWLDVYKPSSITPCTRLNATIEGIEVSGEPDLIVDDVLVDIKCSTKISLKYWVQVNMYKYLDHIRNADFAVSPETFKYNGKVAILRLDKKIGSYEYVVKDYDANCVNVWMSMMRAYVYLKGDDNGDEL